MSVENVQLKPIPATTNSALKCTPTNLMYTIQALFLRVTSQLSTQNQESQKRLTQTKKEYRQATAKSAGAMKSQGDLTYTYGLRSMALQGAGVAFSLALGTDALKNGLSGAAKSFEVTKDFANPETLDSIISGAKQVSDGAVKLTSEMIPMWRDPAAQEEKKRETIFSGEAQIHQNSLSDSQPKGDESTLKNVVEQLLSSMREAFKAAAR